MSRAEEQALKNHTFIGLSFYEIERLKEEFLAGYKQAEQDLIEKVCKWIEDNFSLYEGISGHYVAKELKQSMKND